MPQLIPKGITREHVLKALAELDAGVAHPFGEPTAYDLVHEEKSYPPKAVIGLAARHLLGRMLQPYEFSSGVGPGQAVHVLRKLKFNVVRRTLPLVLNQYRETSSYADIVGQRYHFPNRYLSAFSSLPVPFIYYEPREGGQQVYFGAGIVRSVVADTEDDGHSYADLDNYTPFSIPLDFYAGPRGSSWEKAKTMRNSVRTISAELFAVMISAAGVSLPSPGTAQEHLYEQKLEQQWEDVKNRHGAPEKRLKRRILESYERPSWITNHVKATRGDTCQLCGQRGFLKRDGKRYCEVHHLLHLAEDPPVEALAPEYLVVLCATCHRRMHYADVSTPVRIPTGWTIAIGGETIVFITSAV